MAAVMAAMAALQGARADGSPAAVVPDDWNKTGGWLTGACFEPFTNTVPDWANSQEGSNCLQMATGRAGGASHRFWEDEDWYLTANANTNMQLVFWTQITNRVQRKTFSAVDPLWVDMLVRFTPSYEEPSNSCDYIIRAYASSNNNLVVQVKDGLTITNNAVTLNPTNLYRLTIQLQDITNYVVTVNDTFSTNIPIVNRRGKDAGKYNTPTNYFGTMSGVVFSGFGRVDDIYIGHGKPNRTANFVSALPPFNAKPGGTAWDDRDLHAVNNWMANEYTGSPSGAPDPSIAAKYFLLREDEAFDGSGTLKDPEIDLLLTDFDVLPGKTNITGSVYLAVNGKPKKGHINSWIRLYGSTNYFASLSPATNHNDWVPIGKAFTCPMPCFTNGIFGPVTFDVSNENGPPYRFFKPMLVTFREDEE